MSMINAPLPAGPSLGLETANARGDLHSPHTAEGAGRPTTESRTFQRTATFRLEPSKEQFALLRLRDAQAAQRMNRYSVQLFAERNGWRPPEDSPKDTLTKHGRLERDDLSSSIYVACEKRVQQDWARIGKRIWSGVQMPTYRKGSLPFDSGARPEKGGSCGVNIVQQSDGYYVAELHITATYAEGENWIIVPLGRGTERDERCLQLAVEFSTGARHILRGEIRFSGNKVLLQVAFKVEVPVPRVGERTAALTEIEDGRLLLRTEHQTLDYSSRLTALKEKKLHWDHVRRRFGRRSSRRKGSARRLRQKLANVCFSDFCATEMHQWSADMVRWMQSQGCGFLTVALIGGDWGAHDLAEKLKYKCEAVGISMKEASFDDAPTERAAMSAAKKAQGKAKKKGDAVRTLINTIQ